MYIYIYIYTANPMWGDIFENSFWAHSSKLELLFLLKRGKRNVWTLTFELWNNIRKCPKWDWIYVHFLHVKKRVSSEKDLSIRKRHSTNTFRKKNEKHSAIHVRKTQLHVIRDLQVWRECHDARVTSRRRLRGAPECVVRGWVEGRRIVVCEIYTCVYKYMYVYACL